MRKWEQLFSSSHYWQTWTIILLGTSNITKAGGVRKRGFDDTGLGQGARHSSPPAFQRKCWGELQSVVFSNTASFESTLCELTCPQWTLNLLKSLTEHKPFQFYDSRFLKLAFTYLSLFKEVELKVPVNSTVVLGSHKIRKIPDGLWHDAVLRQDRHQTMFNILSWSAYPFPEVSLGWDNAACGLERNGVSMRSEPEAKWLTQRLPDSLFRFLFLSFR